MLSPIGDGSPQADERVRLIPPEILPLFDDTFVRSCQLIEEYVCAPRAQVGPRGGARARLRRRATVDEAIERAKLDPTPRACRGVAAADTRRTRLGRAPHG